jgi:hypothetical protein
MSLSFTVRFQVFGDALSKSDDIGNTSTKQENKHLGRRG